MTNPGAAGEPAARVRIQQWAGSRARV